MKNNYLRRRTNASAKKRLGFEILESRLPLAAEIEPNDRPSQATVFEPDATLSGVVSSTDDTDYFRIRLNRGDRLLLNDINREAIFGRLVLPPEVELLNSSGIVLDRAVQGFNFGFLVPETDDYYVRITPFSDFGRIIDPYQINTQVIRYAGTEEQEPNGQRGQATQLVGNSLFSGMLDSAEDVDFFEVHLWQNQALVASFSGPLDSRPAITVWGPDGTKLHSDDAGLGVHLQAANAGLYGIEVHHRPDVAGALSYVGMVQVMTSGWEAEEVGNDLDSAVRWPAIENNGLFNYQESFALGELESLDDVDVFRFTSDLHAIHFSLQTNHLQTFSSQGRVVKLFDAYGNRVEHNPEPLIVVGDLERLPQEYFFTVQATTTAGLGSYALRRASDLDFSIQRDVGLHFFDFDRQRQSYIGLDFHDPYAFPDTIPFVMGMNQARFGFLDIDQTTELPAPNAQPYISTGVGNFGNDNDGVWGVGGGYHGHRRASGESANNFEIAIWDRFDEGVTGLINHEFGHAASLPHMRAPDNMMTYVGVIGRVGVGTVHAFETADQFRTSRRTFNTRERLDFNFTPGSQVAEFQQEENVPQNLDSNFLEMTVETADVTRIDLGNRPTFLAAGDINGDSWDDVVVASDAGRISVMLANQQGGFAAPQDYEVDPIAWWTESVVVSDFNADGFADVGVISRERETLTLFQADPSGQLTNKRVESIGRWPNVLKAADMNGDGMIDLLAANANNQINFRAGWGDGTFMPAVAMPSGFDPNHIAIDDFDGNGSLDMAVANYHGDTISVYVNDGSASFSLRETLAGGSVLRGLATVDFDGDGDADIVAGNHRDRVLLTFINQGEGTFLTGKRYPLISPSENIVTGDFNADGTTDLVVSGPDSTFDVVLGTSSGEFSRPIRFGTVGGAQHTISLDVDGDGVNDFVSAGYWQSQLGVRHLLPNSPRNDRVVVHGFISDAHDLDRFQFTGIQGMEYTLDIDSAEFQHPLDARIEIFNADGELIGQSDAGVDRESGIDSSDPFLAFSASATGLVDIVVSGENRSIGPYRLKVTPRSALKSEGPRILAVIPDNGASVDTTREITFAVDRLVDASTLTNDTIIIRGRESGVRPGVVTYDPLDALIIWTADEPLPIDTYDITLKSGGNGISDLNGFQLDGEISSSFAFPKISGDGQPGGDYHSSFSVNAMDSSPAFAHYVGTVLEPSNRRRISLLFTDQLSLGSLSRTELQLRGAGPDGFFDTDDDRLLPLESYHHPHSIVATASSWLHLYTRGFPDSGMYRVEGTVHDVAGHLIEIRQSINIGVNVPTDALFTSADRQVAGLVGSYVDRSLRDVNEPDWRQTQSIAGTRTDPTLAFYTDSLGSRQEVGITGGSDANWDNFSVQWDGFVDIAVDGTRLQLQSDDGARMWVDINDNGVYESAELFDNYWGRGQWVTIGALTDPLEAGLYRVRIQYEEGFQGNRLSFEWIIPDHPSDHRSYAYGPTVIGTSIQPNSTYTGLPFDHVAVQFSGAIDLDTLTPENVRLRFSGDATFYDGNDTYIVDADGEIEWDPTTSTATLRAAQLLPGGYYIIEVNGNENGVRAVNGRLLDGEFLSSEIVGNTNTPALRRNPSGDGVAGGTYLAPFTIGRVNLAPTFDPIDDVVVLEDTSPFQVAIRNISAGPDESQLLRLTAHSDNLQVTQPPVVDYRSPNTAGTLTFTLLPDAHGVSVVTVSLEDAGFDGDFDTKDDNATLTRQFTLTVTAVNDAPTLDHISDVNIDEDAGVQFLDLTGISPGGGEQQPIRITAASSNPDLIATPTVEADAGQSTAILRFESRAERSGESTIRVLVEDGGFDNDLDTVEDNAVTVREFKVTVRNINDPPSMNQPERLQIAEDTPAFDFSLWGISAGGDEQQPLRITVSSSDPLLVPHPVVTYSSPSNYASLLISPAADRFGVVDLSIVLEDGGFDANLATAGDNEKQTYVMTIDIESVNDLPNFNTIGTVETVEDGGQIWIELTEIDAGGGENQHLRFRTVSSNANVVPPPAVNYLSPATSGRLSLVPRPDRSGTSVITVILEDAGNDGLLQTTADNGLFERQITVTVAPTNDPPTLNLISSLVMVEDAAERTVMITGISAGGGEQQPLRLTALSDNPQLIPHPVMTYFAPETSGFLTVSPAANRSGQAVITVTATDGGFDLDLATAHDNQQVQHRLTITVNAVNDPPTFQIPELLEIEEDADRQTIPVRQIEGGPLENAPLRLTAEATDPWLLQDVEVHYLGGSEGLVSLTPVAGQSGTTDVVVRLEDGGLDEDLFTTADNAVTQLTLTVSVLPDNDPPHFYADSGFMILEDSGPVSLPLSRVHDGDNNSQPLRMVATVDHPEILELLEVTAVDASGNAQILVQPVANRSGDVAIHVLLEDGGLDHDLATTGDNSQFSRVLSIALRPVNDPPTITGPHSIVIGEDSGEHSVTFVDVTAGPFEVQQFLVSATSADPHLLETIRLDWVPTTSEIEVFFEPRPGRFGETSIVIRLEDAGDDGLMETTEDNIVLERILEVIVEPIPNDPPRANPDEATTQRNAAVNADVLDNDFDGDGSLDRGSLRIVAPPEFGSVSITPEGMVVYTPAHGFIGQDSFQYVVHDEEGLVSSPAVVSISVVDSLYRNQFNRFDVNSDGLVVPLDALIIINWLNRNGSGRLNEGDVRPNIYLDVSGDQLIAPIDALMVINHLNRRGTGEGEEPFVRPRDWLLDEELEQQVVSFLVKLRFAPVEQYLRSSKRIDATGSGL